MKKLSLKNLKLEASDMLQRDQLKTVFGGYGGSSGWCNESGQCDKDKTVCPNEQMPAPGQTARKGYCAKRACDGDIRYYCDLKSW